MNEQVILNFLRENLEVCLLAAMLMGFIVNQFFSKKALIIAKRKELFAEVNHRSSHSAPIPAFGGISLFVVFVCAALTMVGIGSSHAIGFVVLSSFILFMSGLKDDLMGTSARTKLLVQIGTAVLVLLNSELFKRKPRGVPSSSATYGVYSESILFQKSADYRQKKRTVR
jgi:UDP-N-acetylmuramyl pentapeptide phosphotransferase/UDP-N-acetylglucosamine-1-phosphate transferase